MRYFISLLLMSFLIIGCSSNVRFIQTDDSYVPDEKPANTQIVFRQDRIVRPHQVIGIIEAELGKNARPPQLDALLIQKAREIGADGLMMVEYDVDRNVYLEKHNTIVGRGPWRHHVVTAQPRVAVRKTASAIAVVFR